MLCEEEELEGSSVEREVRESSSKKSGGAAPDEEQKVCCDVDRQGVCTLGKDAGQPELLELAIQ